MISRIPMRNKNIMSSFEIVHPLKECSLTVQTKRLFLSVYKPSAAKRVTDYLVRNRDFHKPFTQSHSESYFTVSEQRDYLRSDIAQYNRNTLVPFWITTQADPDRIIGRLSFYSIIGGAMMSCFVGYHLDEGSQGNGYMREALEAGCAFMFKYYHLHRIEADVMPTNERSLRCVQDSGFVKMGYNVRFMEIDGSYKDHVMLVRLNPQVEK